MSLEQIPTRVDAKQNVVISGFPPAVRSCHLFLTIEQDWEVIFDDPHCSEFHTDSIEEPNHGNHKREDVDDHDKIV